MVKFDFVYYNPLTKNFKTTELWNIPLFLIHNFKNKKIFFEFMNQFLPWLETGSKLYFDNSHEFSNFQLQIDDYFGKSENPFDWVNEFIMNNNLKNNSIQFISGNYSIKDNMTQSYKNLVCTNILFSTFPDYCLDYNFLEKRKFNKKFICILGKIRENREELFNFMKNENILPNSFYSFNTVWSREDKEVHYLEDVEFTKDKKQSELVSYFQKGGTDYQSKSFLNLVSETFFYSNEYGDYSGRGVSYLSEKIFKAICFCQPFILISKPKSLNFLKELGFKTFSDWWDESYDDEMDDTLRFEKIKKEILKINEWEIKKCIDIYKQMIPILKHNYDLTWKIFNDSKYKVEFKEYMFNHVRETKEQIFNIDRNLEITIDKDEYDFNHSKYRLI
jgi:hypothetical protein